MATYMTNPASIPNLSGLQDRNKSSFIDPITAAALISTGGQLVGQFFGGNQEQQQFIPGVTEGDVFSRSRSRLAPESEMERLLAGLQGGLFGRGAGAVMEGNIPGLNDLVSGRIAPDAQSRINRMAYGGLTEGLRRARQVASEEALSRGIGLSSLEMERGIELQQPLIDAAASRAAGLEMAELDRLQGLRQQTIGNALALQSSPALDRLLQIRLTEAQHESFDQTREPGGTDFGGEEAAKAWKDKYTDLKDRAPEILAAFGDHKSGKNRHKAKAALQKAAEAFGFTVGPAPQYLIMDPKGTVIGSLPDLRGY